MSDSESEINRHLYGLVDMGSNGIRFSITDLAPPTTRAMPTVYQSRLGISLYDAQYTGTATGGSRQPISPSTISAVISGLLAFKSTCADFGVLDPQNVTVLATEATRTAVNSKEFLDEIKKRTGWEVKLLAKEEEGRVGAMGVASSEEVVEGLVMDLGGGSTQITYMIARNGEVETSPKGSFSFPYGAAAMTRRLADIDASANPAEAKKKLATEMQENFRNAFANLAIPESLTQAAEKQGGYTLYLSGGGFRGWGYLLMSQSSLAPYPIQIINGFQVPIASFRNTSFIQSVAANSLLASASESAVQSSGKIFRVSKRRATQVPAVAFLISNILEALPPIQSIQFCQGGVREGYLYSTLPANLRASSPLTCACGPYTPKSATQIASLLSSAIPPASSAPSNSVLTVPSHSLITALSQTMYIHSSSPKETASLSAIHFPITGPLASVHGVSHLDRAILAVMLCERWDGELPPPHTELRDRLNRLIIASGPNGAQLLWWAKYLGSVAGLIAGVYPAGRIRSSDGRSGVRIGLKADWAYMGKKGQGVKLSVGLREREAQILGVEEQLLDEDMRGLVDAVEGLGKKKHWIEAGGGAGGGGIMVGYGVEVDVYTLHG